MHVIRLRGSLLRCARGSTRSLSSASNITPQEVTLAIIKPGVASRPDAVDDIRKRARDAGLEIKAQRTLTLSVSRAQKFYAEHAGKFFHQRLVHYVSSGPLTCIVFEGRDAIATWRRLAGPTHPWRARLNDVSSIRAHYGESDTRNAVHGSDSPCSASREISFFFPEL